MFSDSNDFDPIQLSIELDHLRRNLARFSAAPLSILSNPFASREFPGLSTFRSVMRLHDADPLRPALLRHVAWLTDERIHVPWTVKDAALRKDSKHPVREPVEAALSLERIRVEALRGAAHTNSLWWRSYGRAERALSDHRVERCSRRNQVYERLGLHDAFAFWDPVVSEGESQGLVELARAVLVETKDAAENSWGQGWVPLMETALGREAPEGWPARLAHDSLRDLLSASELFRSVVLEPGRLPQRFAPISFARAGAQIGRALSHALRPRDLPSVLAFDPGDLSGHLSAQLFFSWMLSRPFLRRRLGMTRDTLAQSRRHYAAAQLAHARLAATRLLLMESASRGTRAVREEFGELSGALVGEELPPSAVLSRFSVRPDEPARFAALLCAAAREGELIEDYDEDWFENPRAQEQLRAEWTAPCAIYSRASDLRNGLSQLEQRVFADL